MRKSVFVAVTVGMLGLVGCVKDECADCERDNQKSFEIPFTISCCGYDLKAANPSYEDESRINWIDIFVSVDGGDYCRHRIIPGETSSIIVKKGAAYKLGAVANALSDRWDCGKLVSETNGRTIFNSTLYTLSENRLDSFVMMVDEFITSKGEGVHFELKRRVNRCTVRSIKNMWGDPEKFEIKEVYLANVLESWSTDASVEKVFYNYGGYEPSEGDDLLYARVDKTLPYGESLVLNQALYYLPLPGSQNFLVINAVADGVPMSYSFRLPNSLEYNKHYSYDLIITHVGDEDMIPDSVGSMIVSELSGNFEIIQWDETSESRGF
jgi:hypothetical protein